MRTVLHQAMIALARMAARRGGRGAVTVGRDALFFGRPLIVAVAGARIDIGPRVRLVSRSRHTPLGVNHQVVIRAMLPDARVTIGAGSGLSGVTVCAASSVTIGSGCLFGANVTVVDTDFHPVHSRNRVDAPIPAPRASDRVVIGDNVFLGTGSIVLKGVSIGDNCVVGAGSVVTTDCAPNAIVAGNPARVVGQVRLPGQAVAEEVGVPGEVSLPG